MSHKHHKQHIPYCLNCHYPTAEYDSFCPNCGQKITDGKTTVHDLMHEFTHSVFHIDGKLFSTMRHVFIPGKLTEEFFKGHHKRYAHPVQMFLVLGTICFWALNSTVNKGLEDLGKESLKNEEKAFKNDLLFNIDSVRRHDSVYKTPSVQTAFDSLIDKFYFKGTNYIAAGDSLTVREKYVNLKNKIKLEKQRIARLKYFSVEKGNASDSISMILQAFKKADLNIKNYEKDSVELIKAYAVEREDSIPKAKTSLETHYSGSMLGRSLVRSQKVKSETLSEILDAYKLKSAGFTTPVNLDDTLKKRSDTLRVKELKHDSLKIGSNLSKLFNYEVTVVDSRDIYQLKEKELIKKYKVEGTFHRILVSQSIKARKNGGNELIHFFMGKFLWISIFSLLPSAFILHLLYRKKHLFVENVVFLLHYTSLTFLLSIPMFLTDNDYLIGFCLFLYFVSLFFAMKRYYKQGWLKTFGKFLLAFTGTQIIGLIITLFALVLSMIFF